MRIFFGGGARLLRSSSYQASQDTGLVGDSAVMADLSVSLCLLKTPKCGESLEIFAPYPLSMLKTLKR